ncbi:MAG TPA: MBL fold metallo-hydrolase [Epsilonproteobacteria bacterium]|nr:MBL fold metallo-hydrolase [Campylobacterota bacterium]
MRKLKKTLLLLLLSPLFLLAQPRVALQVLGSGGPESGDNRASSGYIVWINGKSRVLVDFGGGTSLRFEEAGAKIEDLDVILLTHLHIDHTADLPALLKSGFFVKRSRDLPIYGPANNHFMPGTKTFIERLFANNKGAWEYMGDYLDGTAAFQVKAHTVAPTKTVKTIYKQGNVAVQAITVHHGPIPALAYRVTVGSKSITFSGDMNGDYHTLETLAKGTDILVAHNAVPKGATGVGANLHMTPMTIGKIAQKAGVRSLVLSHRMLRTLKKGSETKREIRKNYRGPVKFANDLSMYRINF